MGTNILRFINHASYYIANDESVLLIDPWVQGSAFNNGWSLLDGSTSNAALVAELAELGRKTYIWFSHEHPDHFSISFIKQLKQDFPGKITVLFQHTKDKRVVNFLRRSQFEVIECQPGETFALDASMAITVFPHADGDSWCLVNAGGRTVLNLNDCALTNADMCQAIKRQVARLCERVDVLLTQFGYANWIGNPFQPELRRAAAEEKIYRIRLQMEILAPRITVPFASFVAFASVDNCYLNDQQNTARMIAHWARQSRATDTVRFLKPGDDIELNVDTAESLAWASDAAVEHWERLGAARGNLLAAEPAASAADLRAAVSKHCHNMQSNLLGLPWLLETLGLIHSLTIRLPDAGLTIRASYVSGYSELPADARCDISMTSASALFLFNNEYGFNTTHVNGRFRTADDGALTRFARFFMPQNLGRQGYGVQHPLATLRYLAGNVATRIGRLAAPN